MDDKGADPPHLPPDEAEVRRRAARRVWVCAGAGYALIGRPGLGVATYLTALASMLGLGWLCVAPGPVLGWASLALLGVAVVLWVSELIAVKRAAIRSAAPALLVRGYPAAAVVGLLAGGGAVVALVLFVGSFVIAGGGMAPTLDAREQLLYHKRVHAGDLHPGRVVAFRTSDRSAWQPGALVVARIIAGPGDRIATLDGRYLVNGEPGPPVGPALGQNPVIVVPPAPASLTVPDDCYFIGQDNPKGGYDSSALSWAERKDLVSTRIWYLRRDRLLDRVE
jgi:signal peptidase I